MGPSRRPARPGGGEGGGAMTPPCPKGCLDSQIAILWHGYRQNNTITARRLHCRNCGHRWTVHTPRDEQWPSRCPRRGRLTDDQVAWLLTSTLSNAEAGIELGISASLASLVRTRKRYAHIRPDLPAWTPPERVTPAQMEAITKAVAKSRVAIRKPRKSCRQCVHHNEKSCGLGIPDYKAEGMYFAQFCEAFTNA